MSYPTADSTPHQNVACALSGNERHPAQALNDAQKPESACAVASITDAAEVAAREVPRSKTITAWVVGGRTYQRKSAAYYALAKAMVLERYPVWLTESATTDEERDELAKLAGIADWRARSNRRLEVFYEARCDSDGAIERDEFVLERWDRLVRRLARFLALVDARREPASEPRTRKEAVYDKHISPLMAQVIAICKEHKINAFVEFSLDYDKAADRTLFCTTALPVDKTDEKGYEHIVDIARRAKGGRSSGLMAITIIGGEGGDA